MYLTCLYNHDLPLIRYELDDQLRVLPQRCGCGSAMTAIEDCWAEWSHPPAGHRSGPYDTGLGSRFGARQPKHWDVPESVVCDPPAHDLGRPESAQLICGS